MAWKDSIEKGMRWAGNIANEYKIEKKRGKMIGDVAVQKAKKIHEAKYGYPMTGPTLQDELDGNTKAGKEYVTNRENINRDLQKKMKSKGVYQGRVRAIVNAILNK